MSTKVLFIAVPPIFKVFASTSTRLALIVCASILWKEPVLPAPNVSVVPSNVRFASALAFEPSPVKTLSLALLEIGHALFRLVPSNPFTVSLQVLSRIVVLWGVLHC